MKLTVVGCGDAFGSGGRLQTCFHVASGGGNALIDCGATAVLGCNRLGLEPNRVSNVFVSHLHGDHFSGLVWWLLHAVHVVRRREPLTVTGPRGIEARFGTAAEALFPGALSTPRDFELRFLEYREQEPLAVGAATVTPFEVRHPSGAPSYALRLAMDGKTIGFSGDTEWVENLVPVAAGADLFITECHGFEHAVRYHMTWQDIRRNIDRLSASRVLLTHMSTEMLGRRTEIEEPRVILAEDGLVLDV